MLPKKNQLLTQFFISLTMAFLMTGIFSFIELGFSLGTIKEWLMRFVQAWPIAFALSIIVSKYAIKAAIHLTMAKQPKA